MSMGGLVQGMDAFNQQIVEDPKLIKELEKVPNPETIWAAFRARLIREETVHRLLPDNMPTFRQRTFDALLDVFAPRW